MERKSNVYVTPEVEIVVIEVEQSLLNTSLEPSDGEWGN